MRFLFPHSQSTRIFIPQPTKRWCRKSDNALVCGALIFYGLSADKLLSLPWCAACWYIHMHVYILHHYTIPLWHFYSFCCTTTITRPQTCHFLLCSRRRRCWEYDELLSISQIELKNLQERAPNPYLKWVMRSLRDSPLYLGVGCCLWDKWNGKSCGSFQQKRKSI